MNPLIIQRKAHVEEPVGLCVLVPKTLWSRLARPGAVVTARVNGAQRRLRVAGVQCTCRGPDRPHEHRFLVLPAAAGLRAGEAVRVELA